MEQKTTTPPKQNKKQQHTHHGTGTCKSIIIMYDIIYKYPSFYANKGELVESSTVLDRQKCTVIVWRNLSFPVTNTQQ